MHGNVEVCSVASDDTLVLLLSGTASYLPDLSATYHLITPCWLGMVQMVRAVVEAGDVSQLRVIHHPHDVHVPQLELRLPGFATPSCLELLREMMLCWPLIIMNLPVLIASHRVGGSFRSALFSSTGVRHTFCSCLTLPIWMRVFFMSSTNDLYSVRMIKSSRAMMHWLMCTLVASVSNRKHASWFCQNSL